jgi:hypothetical protein
MAVLTPALALSKPQVNGAETENTWGLDLNSNFDKIDAWVGPLPERITALEIAQVAEGAVGEAPNDGQTYGRQSLDWTPLVDLQPALDLKAPLDSPALTGTPTAPTAATAVNDTQIATTAFVQQVLSVVSGGTVLEAPNDGQTYGRKSLIWTVLDTSIDWADLTGVPATFPPSGHIHGIPDVVNLQTELDARAPLASPVFTGVPQAPSPPNDSNDNKLATTFYVKSQGFAVEADVVHKAGDIMSGGLTIAAAGQFGLDAKATDTNPANYNFGLIGRTAVANIYGISGYYTDTGLSYSFYGNNSAYLASGVWATSDGRFKDVTGDFDRGQALAAVNAIPVKAYRAKSPAAQMYIYGQGGPALFHGWLAQDVERIIPVAVRDVAVPKDDRAVVKGDSVKAINDRYMLAMLWAAVQQLSVEVSELKAGSRP